MDRGSSVKLRGVEILYLSAKDDGTNRDQVLFSINVFIFKVCFSSSFSNNQNVKFHELLVSDVSDE